MPPLSLTAIALLAGVTVFHATTASAQARGAAPRKPQRSEAVASSEANQDEVATWLRRLPGQYKIGVTYQPLGYSSACGPSSNGAGPCQQPDPTAQYQSVRPLLGSAKCKSVGTGPGVTCQLDIADSDGAIAPRLPRVILFGLDPDKTQIWTMEVDGAGAARVAHGSLKTDTFSFRMACVKSSDLRFESASCFQNFRFRALPDGRRIDISITTTSSTPVQVRNAWVAIPGIITIELQ